MWWMLPGRTTCREGFAHRSLETQIPQKGSPIIHRKQPAVLAAGCLLSDVALAGVEHKIIGYGHIKQRRMTQYRVPCCGNRFVGEFVPPYFCPRSPVLFTVNRGATGRPPGCQKDIVHMVTTVAHAVGVGQSWAIADGNAGAGHTGFRADLAALTIWTGRPFARHPGKVARTRSRLNSWWPTRSRGWPSK